MAKDELVDVTPTSVVGGGLEVDPVVKMLDSDEFAELIRLSRASRSARSTVRHLSYVAWTSAKSFLISSNSAYAKFRTKLKTILHHGFRETDGQQVGLPRRVRLDPSFQDPESFFLFADAARPGVCHIPLMAMIILPRKESRVLAISRRRTSCE